MKKYDEVEAKTLQDDEVQGQYFEVKTLRNGIVLTVEEAKEIWEAGRRAKTLENNPDAKFVDFKSWMKHKGIQLD